MPLGYEHGNDFGNPAGFTRSTQEWEIDNFNKWMRSQPEWQAIRGNSTGDFSDLQAAQLERALQAKGITVPKDFHIDQGGNFNQKSRVKRNLALAGLVGAGVLTGGGAFGMGPLAGIMGGGAAAGAGAGAGTLASTTIGAGFIPAVGAGAAGAGAAGTAGAIGAGAKLAGLGKSLLTSKGLEAGGRMLGAFGDTAAANRGAAAEVALHNDRNRLDFEENARRSETDALRKLARANYLSNFTAPGPRVSASGMTIPTFGNGVKAPSAAQQEAAKLLEAEMLARFRSPEQATDLNQFAKPGKGERFANILGPAATFGSTLMGR